MVKKVITPFIAFMLLTLISCSHSYRKSPELEKAFLTRAEDKTDTLIVHHTECTECLDLYIDSGTLTIPKDLLPISAVGGNKDIKVCGNFPIDLLGVKGYYFEHNLYFKITGKVIATDTHNAVGKVPMFYVEHWEKTEL